MSGSDEIISYAQNREDVILSAFFLEKEKGFYVDIGANEPVNDSVTKYFYDRGWRGINIEPNPRIFKKLLEQRPRDLNLNIGVSDKEATLSFREYKGHGLSTFSDYTKKELLSKDNHLTAKFTDYDVKVEKLEKIFDESSPPKIDFMKIDVEGYEYEVITGNNWDNYRPKVICIEANHIHRDWPTFLVSKKYMKIFNDGLNDYYVDQLEKNIKFNYIEALIGRKIIPAFIKSDLVELRNTKERMEYQLSTSKRYNHELELEVDTLNNHLREQKRIRNLLRGLIVAIDGVIVLHLKKIARGRHYYPKTDLITNSNPTIKGILDNVHAADIAAINGNPGVLQRIIESSGEIILYAYNCIKKIAYRSLRTIYRKLKNRRTQ